MKLDKFSQDDFIKASNRLVRSLTRGKSTSSQPKAILLGGQSGAGKTTIHRVKQREFQGNIMAYRKSMEKIVWIIPKYLRAKWLNIL